MKDANGFKPAEWHLWRLFMKANARLSRRMDSQLQSGSGLHQGEYGTLAAILESPRHRLRIGEIAKELGWERSRTSHLAARMEKNGLVERSEDTKDGRSAWLSATSAGRRRFLAAVRGHAAEVRAAFLDQIPDGDRPAVARALERIIAHSD